MQIQIRIITSNEFKKFIGIARKALSFLPSFEELEKCWRLFESNKCYAAFDGTQMIATMGSYDLNMIVPGNSVKTTGVGVVSVLPTHRRQGLLRRLMAQFLIDTHEQNVSLSALWASESPIYSRFGYGSASNLVNMSLPKPYAIMQEDIDIIGAMRYVNLDEALDILPAIYSNAIKCRPGMLARQHNWWQDRILSITVATHRGSPPHHRVIHLGENGPDGYVLYKIHHGTGINNAKVEVLELIGGHPKVEKALWQYLFGIDLIGTIQASNRPVDDPLNWWLMHPDRIQRNTSGAFWLRLIDVQAALNKRRYLHDGSICFRCVDPICRWNEGVYHLEVADGIGQCSRSKSPPELEMPAHALGSVYLGGWHFQELAHAGIISAPQKLTQRLDSMFGWHFLPWCNDEF